MGNSQIQLKIITITGKMKDFLMAQVRQEHRQNKARSNKALLTLKNDVAERVNVAGKYPEVVKKLEELAEAAREDLGDKLTGQSENGVIEPVSLGVS